MGAVHRLRVKSPYKLLKVEDINIKNRPNEHGYLYLKCLIDDSINFDSAIKASTEDKICIYEEQDTKNNDSVVDINKIDEQNSKIIFNGLIKTIKTTNINGVYYLEIEGITSSSELDIKEKSRSFQNVTMTYDELIGLILKDYSGYSFTQNIGQGKKIEKPIFQYKETDWGFLKRIANELKSELYCDIMEIRNMFYFGIPEKHSYNLQDSNDYIACKNLKKYHEAGGCEGGFDDTDYFYYELRRREKYEVGDEIYFKKKKLYVKEYEAYRNKEEVIYKYRLCRKNGVWQAKLYNSLIGGASIEGKVLDVQGQEVKLHLAIDENQNKEEASWFPYAPPTGNTMYSMPIVGTSAKLYFPDETSTEPSVTGCVRTNGGSCAKTADTTKRYFGTEHGSELEMTPNALNIKGGSKEPLSVSFDDNVGITIKSPKKLMLNANEEIIMKTPKSVKLNAQSQIIVAKTNSKNGFVVENDMHFLSNNVIKDGRDRETFANFNDEPKAAPKPEKKKGFNWGRLLVAVVAVAAVAISIATFGVGAVLVGAAIGAACGIVSTAISDIISGKRSSFGTYLKNAFLGAISGAIFGPFGAFESLGGMMAFGALTGVADSLLSQAADGEFSLWRTLIDGGIGGLTGGLFHGASKVFKSLAPCIKNAIGKIANKLESLGEKGLIKLAEGLDNCFNSLNRAAYNLRAKPQLAGVGSAYPPPEEQKIFKDYVNKIIKKGESRTVEPEFIDNERINTKEGKRNTRSENNLRRKLENRRDEHGNRIYSDDEIDAIMNVRNSEYEVTLENGDKITIKRHGYQKDDAEGQSHHLSQDAAYREAIPREEGLAIDLDGNVFMDPESSHYRAHETMEEFWDSYRSGGELYHSKPTIGEYNSALRDSMINAGFSESDSDLITEIAANQQRAYGLTEVDEVPRIPGKINAIGR